MTCLAPLHLLSFWFPSKITPLGRCGRTSQSVPVPLKRGWAPLGMRFKRKTWKMDTLLKPLWSSSTPLDRHSHPKSIKKGCQKEIQKWSKRGQNHVPRKVTRNVVWTHYLLRFGHIEQSRNHMFLLGLGCTILVKKASPEKHPSTHTLGGWDGHLEVPNVIFVSHLGSPLGW